MKAISTLLWRLRYFVVGKISSSPMQNTFTILIIPYITLLLLKGTSSARNGRKSFEDVFSIEIIYLFVSAQPATSKSS